MTKLQVSRFRVEAVEDMSGMLADADTTRVPLTRHVPKGALMRASSGDVLISSGHVCADVRARGGFLKTDRISLGMNLDSNSTSYCFRSGRELLPGDVYVFTRGDDYDVKVTGSLSYAFLSVSAGYLLEQGEPDVLRGSTGFWEQRTWFSAPPPIRASVTPSIQRLVSCLWHSAPTLAGHALRQWQSELTEAFLKGIVSDERNSDERHTLPAATLVRNVENWVDGQPPETIHIADLCRALRVSRRTLHRAFTKTLGIGPARYLMLKRLTAVRTELRGSEPGSIKVTDAAVKYGFWELGRFARDYRQIFGERPSETLLKGSHQMAAIVGPEVLHPTNTVKFSDSIS